MKARLSTLFTLLALIGGSAGALAVASGSGGGGSSAAQSQYRPGKRCGQHKTQPKSCPKPHKPGKGHRGRGHRRGEVKGRFAHRGAPSTATSFATLIGSGAPRSASISGVTTQSGTTDLVVVYYYGPASCDSANPRASGPFSPVMGGQTIQSIVSGGSTKSCIAILQATGTGQTGTVATSLGGGDSVGFVNVLQLAPGVSVRSTGQNPSTQTSSQTALATLPGTGGSQIAVVGLDGNGGSTTITPPAGLGLYPGFSSPQSDSGIGQNGGTLGIYTGSPALSRADFGLSPAANWGTIALEIG